MESTAKTSTHLFGHTDAEALLLRDFAAGTLAHGWILAGPKGIGKATLAYRIARALLGGDNRITAGSHAGLLVVEPLYDEKKEENAREISVDQAREIARFFSLTPGEGEWRVVIIDSADILNMNAANAILKILEEPPPQSLLLLIAHNTGKLLPTIRSRCRMLKLKPLERDDFIAVMREISPANDSADLRTLAILSGHAPGLAIQMHEQGAVALYNEIAELLSGTPNIDSGQLHAFADQMTGGQVHTRWQLLTRLMLCLLGRVAMRAAGTDVASISDTETRLLDNLATLHPAAVWAAKWQQCADQFLLAEARHLDYKQMIICFFHSIASAEGFQIGNAA